MTEKNNNNLSTLDKIVSAFNKAEEASITWSYKDKCLVLHDKSLTPVTSSWIREFLFIEKNKEDKGDKPLTVDDFKKFKVTGEDVKYFDIPWIDGHIEEEVLKDFKEVHDDESAKYVYWSGNGNIKRVK